MSVEYPKRKLHYEIGAGGTHKFPRPSQRLLKRQAKIGEQGVADLIAVNGYYVLVSMTVNVDRTPIPNGGKPPLPILK